MWKGIEEVKKRSDTQVTKSSDGRRKKAAARQRDEKRLKKQNRLWIKSEREDDSVRFWLMKDDEYLF